MSKANQEAQNHSSISNTSIERGNYNERIGRDSIDVNEGGIYINVERDNHPSLESNSSENIPSNLTRTGSANFVGREEQLVKVYELLKHNETVSISSIAGMGGIGKTELALQYAKNYRQHYPGGICWFSVRGESLVTQIIEFARSCLNIFPPDELQSDQAKLNYCWRQWRKETSLIILDDVPDYDQFYREQIAPYLPPVTSNIRVLMTSRELSGSNILSIDLDVLTEDKALKLLRKLTSVQRINAELELAKNLCKWLGYFTSRFRISWTLH
ncbi:MAG: NB-ARC domain-containing protein [Cyanobacteria bacterium P01_A01_bin.40]